MIASLWCRELTSEPGRARSFLSPSWKPIEMKTETKPRPALPPFTEESARQKIQAAEDAWNTRDPERVALTYTEDTEWRNRHEFFAGRAEIVEFLRRKWSRELDYALRKDLRSFH